MARNDRWLVISWDDDEQQAYWDVILASSDEKAVGFVDEQRGDYAKVVDFANIAQLERTLKHMKKLKIPEIVETMKRLVKDNPNHSEFFEEKERLTNVFGCTCGEEVPLADKDEHIAECSGMSR